MYVFIHFRFTFKSFSITYTKFFMRLTPGSMFEILVRRFGATAGECQMPGPGIVIVTGALDEQEFRAERAGAGHKGYPTAAHYAALAAHGPSPHHRRSFRLTR